MSRYYFHIRNGHILVRDDEGMECRDMRAVQDEAQSSNIDLVQAALRTGAVAASIEVEDEDGNAVLMLAPKRLLN
jgi:hypothetical protein